jgi:UDPglucose 6-dehydrogenase
MRVTMIGAGYVGLVSGACFADFGHTVTCVDKDPGKIDRLEKGVMPIFEPGLAELVASNVKEGRLFFSLDAREAIKNADAVFIAVGTPSRRGDGHADLSYVYAAAERRSPSTSTASRSSSPSRRFRSAPGDEVEEIIRKTNPNAKFAVVSNPNSCAKAPRSATSSGPTASSSALTNDAPAR